MVILYIIFIVDEAVFILDCMKQLCVCVFFCVVMARPLLQLQLGMFERFYCVSLLLRLWVRI